jgi:hypothetical protein
MCEHPAAYSVSAAGPRRLAAKRRCAGPRSAVALRLCAAAPCRSSVPRRLCRLRDASEDRHIAHVWTLTCIPTSLHSRAGERHEERSVSILASMRSHHVACSHTHTHALVVMCADMQTSLGACMHMRMLMNAYTHGTARMHLCMHTHLQRSNERDR